MTNILINLNKPTAGVDLRGTGTRLGLESELSDYIATVEADSGSVADVGVSNVITRGLKDNGLLADTKLLWFGDAGIKTRETTVAYTPLTFVSKGYSLDPTPNDLTQTTELDQPYLSGNIAPNERYGVKINTNSGTKSLIHPAIVISSPHTIVKVANSEISGKIEITHTEVNSGTYNSINDTGRLYYYRIQSGAMTEAQVQAEHNTLRAIYPEIPSVTIGTQTWATSNLEMVVTPMGNMIPEVQEATNSATLNVSDTENHSYVTFTTSGYGGFSATSDGSSTQRAGTAREIGTLVVGQKYLVEFDLLLNSGVAPNIAMLNRLSGQLSSNVISASNGSNKYILTVSIAQGASVLQFYNLSGETTDYVVSNLSVKKVGWSGLTDAYDTLIAQGMSVADATKECAAWCYYNNDPSIGAVYGKLYNWYAAKLIQNDIDAYNVANPSTPWGWRVPVKDDFDALAVTLGGESIAGGKMKVAGTDYWDSPNTEATNESGFSSISSGWRLNDGNFTNIRLRNRFIYLGAETATNYFVKTVGHNYGGLLGDYIEKTRGASIRLIKD